MAVISKRLIFRHLQAGPTSHVRRLRRGELASSGTGSAFWFRPLGASISEVPVEEQERSVLFRARTSDHQEVAVQATLTYRIVEPDVAATRLDFSIDTQTGHWNRAPLETLGGVLTEMAQEHANRVLSAMPLAAVMENGIAAVQQTTADGLASDPWLREAGIGTVGVRVIGVRPDADMEKALQNPVREMMQQEADRATYERRARAVQQERAISENELENRIELAKREEELVQQNGANERSRATQEAESSRIANEAKARDALVAAEAGAERTRMIGKAAAAAERAKVEVLSELDDSTLLVLAARDLATNLPAIDTLVLSPDMVAPLLAKLVRTLDAGERPEA